MDNLPENTNNAWYDILGAVMKIPGVKVDRRRYLTNEFSRYCDHNMLVNILEEGTGKAGVSSDIMDKIADGTIGLHSTLATGLSFAAGIPGGFAMIGTIPADLAQYYYHVLQMAQKLAYVYGWPDLDNGASDDFLMMITIFVGIMSGVQGANVAINSFAKMLSATAVKKYPRWL